MHGILRQECGSKVNHTFPWLPKEDEFAAEEDEAIYIVFFFL